MRCRNGNRFQCQNQLIGISSCEKKCNNIYPLFFRSEKLGEIVKPWNMYSLKTFPSWIENWWENLHDNFLNEISCVIDFQIEFRLGSSEHIVHSFIRFCLLNFEIELSFMGDFWIRIFVEILGSWMMIIFWLSHIHLIY